MEGGVGFLLCSTYQETSLQRQSDTPMANTMQKHLLAGLCRSLCIPHGLMHSDTEHGDRYLQWRRIETLFDWLRLMMFFASRSSVKALGSSCYSNQWGRPLPCGWHPAALKPNSTSYTSKGVYNTPGATKAPSRLSYIYIYKNIYTWWTFRPRKRHLAPAPQKFPNPTLPTPRPLPLLEPPPGIFKKN